MTQDTTEPQDQLVAMMDRVYRQRMTTTSGGNISMKDGEGNVWITPSGIDKGCLTRDDIVCIRADGSVTGKHKPSSEYPFHLAVYAARCDVKAVLHAHPAALVAFSAADLVPDADLEPLVRLTCGKVELVPYALPGSALLGEKIAARFAKGADVVLLENHGTVTVGENLAGAFRRFEAFDFFARTLLLSVGIGKKSVPEEKDIVGLAGAMNACGRPSARKTGGATGGERAEAGLKAALAQFSRRAYTRKLFNAACGAFSARLSGEAFLMSRHDFDPAEAIPDDFTLSGDRHSGNAHPFAPLLEGIYRANNDVGSILFASPPNLMSFLVTDAFFDSRIIPEAYILLRDVPSFSLGDFLRDPGKIAGTICESVPLVFVKNLGVIVTGSNPLQCFDRLEVAEFTAEGLLGAERLGQVHRVGEKEIDELKVAFKLA